MYISILLLPEGNERTRIQTYVVRTTEMKNEEEEEAKTQINPLLFFF
jgi:hypothetical protein